MQLLHNGLPAGLSRVHAVPVEILVGVLAYDVKPLRVLTQLPAVPLGIKALAARRQLVFEPLGQPRAFTCFRARRSTSQSDRAVIRSEDAAISNVLVHTWGWIDDVGEGGGEVEDMDVLGLAQIYSQVAVVEVHAHVGPGVADGVVGRPGKPRRAADGVQLVHQDLLHPELLQPLHVRRDLGRHLLDESDHLPEKRKRSYYCS